jgi:hypothetical protein
VGNTIIWALLTGLVTGGAWVGVVLLQRQRRLKLDQTGLRAELERRLDQLEGVDQRLAELEERLDFTERVLAKERQAARLGRPQPE